MSKTSNVPGIYGIICKISIKPEKIAVIRYIVFRLVLLPIMKNTNKIKRTLVIFGCMKDKNSTRMVQYLTGGLRGCAYAAAAVDYGRAESPERIAGLVSASGRGCIICDDTEDAYRTAMSGNYQCILVTGSIYLAGEMRALYLREH